MNLTKKVLISLSLVTAVALSSNASTNNEVKKWKFLKLNLFYKRIVI